jgi:hypothetical protein
MGPNFTQIKSALRSIAFVVFAMLLILVLLPAALVAAGT